MLKVTRWDDDAITLDRLRIRITSLTQPKPTPFQKKYLYEFCNWRTAGRILIKSGVGVMQ
jgi:hypothetical protein